MANIAILVGNTEYQNLSKLPCCEEDLLAIKELLDATGKFELVELLQNRNSSQLKDGIRSIVDSQEAIEEVFFYFTGHGFQHEAEFFFCATNFDTTRPNETGLSNTELHTLLKSTEAELVVKVIDACSSGTLLLKSDGSFLSANKQAFKNLIQIASCLDSQNSLTGDPLSLFTDKFRGAVLRKLDGAVYYTDIIDALRDEFLNNNNQTPHFVSQGTGREQFADNAKRFEGLRLKLAASVKKEEQSADAILAINPQPTQLALLEEAEKKFAKKDRAQAFISQLFEKISTRAGADKQFSELFQSEIVVHPDFQEITTRTFIIRVLSNEKRPDNFVTAAISYKQSKRNPLLGSIAAMFDNSDEAVAHYDLHLNCQLDKAQMKLTFTPKFVSLKRFVLVISCAPSLEICYVMEMLTQHSLNDWNVFDLEGSEVARRWYKMAWTSNCDFLVEKIFAKLNEVIKANIDSTAKALQSKPA